MPRGRRYQSAPDVNALEQELEELKRRQAELRARIRQQKKGAGGVPKLEDKLVRQFASAKWTVQQIRELQPDWDEWGFYRSVQAKEPTPRGRRRRIEPSE